MRVVPRYAFTIILAWLSAASATVALAGAQDGAAREISLHLRAADSLLAEGRTFEAMGHLESALRLDSTRLDIRRKVAQIYIWNNLLEEAIQQYEIILETVPDDTAALRTLADLYFWTDREAEGVDLLERLLELRPEDDSLRREVAQHCSWAGRYRRAAEHYKVLLRRSPRDTALVRALKDNLLWAGETELALAAYKYLLRLDPSRLDRWLDYARLCSWNQKFDDAIRSYQLLLEQDALTDSTFHEYVQVLIWAGKQRSAIRELARWLAKHPHDQWSRWRFVQLLDWNSVPGAVIRKQLLTLLHSSPQHRPARRMLRRLLGFPERRGQGTWQYVTDSNNLTTQLIEATATEPLGDRFQCRAVTWHQSLSEVRPDTSAAMWGNGASAEVRAFFGLSWMASYELRGVVYRDGWRPFGQAFRLFWLPTPSFWVQLRYRQQESLAGAFGLKSHLRERSWSAYWYYEPSFRLSIRGWLERTRVSDGNTKVAAFVNWDWRFRIADPVLDLTGYLGVEDYQRIYPNSIPYWTPDRLQHRSVGIEGEQLVSPRLGISAGLALAQNPGYPLSVNARGSLILHFSPAARLLLEYYDFGSRAYHSSTFTCRLTLDF